jgi:PAS domain S-box-containing protein
VRGAECGGVAETRPAAARLERRRRPLVRVVLEQGGREAWVDQAELALSEIVTNAFLHAGTRLRLQVCVDSDGLRVEVGDGSPHLPVRREYSSNSGTGRGLRIVNDLVDEWGAFSHGDGKIVWFEIRSKSQTHGEPFAHLEGSPSSTPTDTVEVELLNFPLLMHAAWQEHASALLREFLLLHLDDDEMASVERHSQASDALNVLYEQVPELTLYDEPDAIMASATEPGVSAARLVLRVPRTSVPHFDTLDAMLADAIASSISGGMLGPPTQPEMRDMRRWVCQQVRDQSAGAAVAQPWAADVDAAGPSDFSISPGWDRTEISEAEGALLATDDASLIVAVSPAAVSLLGYRNEEQLLGERIIRIVPARYHQAHIAGTTLHMTNGRSPLLGVRVTVPVVRADGTETPMGLEVRSRALPAGRRLFVAEFHADDEAASE